MEVRAHRQAGNPPDMGVDAQARGNEQPHVHGNAISTGMLSGRFLARMSTTTGHVDTSKRRVPSVGGPAQQSTLHHRHARHTHTHTPLKGDIKKRKDYASQVQLRALRKGPLTSKLARASPRKFTGTA
eukprot:1142056-Pelagomonas_calceolata.AAC.1